MIIKQKLNKINHGLQTLITENHVGAKRLIGFCFCRVDPLIKDGEFKRITKKEFEIFCEHLRWVLVAAKVTEIEWKNAMEAE